ncbi:hypothetical protein [Aquitalea magnusonii]|uniref:hypothetical protein n=1 Tax=Aquitalea magnusonii TaxID=332411 RepID=UPI00128F0E91|nr:hypothetical protein [Aquitalea magnusonii]
MSVHHGQEGRRNKGQQPDMVQHLFFSAQQDSAIRLLLRLQAQHAGEHAQQGVTVIALYAAAQQETGQ